MSEIQRFTLEEAHREFAKQTNGQVWKLMEKTDRTPEEDRDMVAAAFTSAYHWRIVGTPLNDQRAEWLLARVYTVLEDAEKAVSHAKACRALTDANLSLMKDFDLAYAAEGLARALALAGNHKQAEKLKEEAHRLGDKIQDPEDKKIFDGDLNSGNWFGL